MHMKIPIVDENDNQIGIKERSELHPTDRYRVSALWLVNQNGETLIAQRALTKKHHPGCWGCSVAGTVEEGETYEDNILKEAEEEIGLALSSQDLQLGPKILIEDEHKHFCQFYFSSSTKHTEEFVVQEDEVMEVKWVNTEELISEVREHPEKYSVDLKECLILREFKTD